MLAPSFVVARGDEMVEAIARYGSTTLRLAGNSPKDRPPLKLRQPHSVPRFEGAASRHHHDVPVWRLAAQAVPAMLRHAPGFARAGSFAQFVGFPRSGHSLIGAILDAHPAAVIAHELDVIGLIDKDVPLPLIHGMIALNSKAFTANGRWWNGFSYAVPEGSHAIAADPLVVGDKKGDWAVRRCGADPALLERARRMLGGRDRWILVVRHPADNIATMSLRETRVYDELRVRHREGGFDAALRQAQAEGRIAASVPDAMIADYEGLCTAIERMRNRLPAESWHTIVYEDFAARPVEKIAALYRFLGLPFDEGFIAKAAGIVRPGSSASRERIEWSGPQEGRVRELIERFDFLAPYR